MESAPPSYENATLVDFWDLVAHYMPSSDLTTAALVCSRWHSTFTPHIWGNPASHFGIENDRVYVALTRFSRNLKTARLLVRSLTHTLHIPPAQAEIYNGPHADWLRDMLQRLPNLQSLIVRSLPFFDHGALQALAFMQKQAIDHSPPHGVSELPASTGILFQNPTAATHSFGLRLLDASRCSNVTSNGLAWVLGRFEGLLYLDLSFTYPARNPAVLATLSKCRGLQVLKLRGVSLRDKGVDILSRSIGHRVRSLDVRDNELTDRSVRKLLDHCFVANATVARQSTDPSDRTSPSLLPYLGSEMLEVYEGECFESYLRNAFTGRFVSRLAIEDVPAGGITHLYIAGNPLTVEGLSGLVRSGSLHVLDAGSVLGRPTGNPPWSACDKPTFLDILGPSKLTPVLAKHAAQSMTFLRIGHDLVTIKVPSPERVIAGRAELDDTALPDLPRNAAELDSAHVPREAYEMDIDPIEPRFELHGDSIHSAISPNVENTVHIPRLVEPNDAVRRGSALAPEVIDDVDGLATQMDEELMLSPSSAFEAAPRSAHSSSTSTPSDFGMPLAQLTRPRSYSSMAMERVARLAAHRAIGNDFHPSMLPRTTTLVLTDLPPFSPTTEVADRIISFIKCCAEESSLAIHEAHLDYSLPPGRKGHASALRHAAAKLFALKRLVIELAPVSGTSKVHRWQQTGTKSVTEDRDSEELWSAAQTDFSFFGEEECVFPTLDMNTSSIISGSNEKEVRSGPLQTAAARAPATTQPMIDNIAMISQFRKERKLAFERILAAGNLDPVVEGFWDGVVQVVRHSKSLRNHEEADYYGNVFSNNYLYR